MRRLLLSFLSGLTGVSLAAERPNVIVIVTDDQGYGDLSCHGNPWLKTPNLDRLHDEGVSLDQYHVDPVCTPTRAALMTGRYCARVGAWAVTEGRQLLHADETTMAEVFAASGYHTAMIGKWHLGDPYPYGPRFRGFQTVVKHMAGGVDEISNPKGNNYFDDTYYRNGVAESFDGYCTDVWFDETLRFIEEGPKEQPFFIYLPTNAMHGPFTAPESDWKPFLEMGHDEERSKFFGMIHNFDANLGRLLSVLDESGRSEDTLLIFMGDNGTARGADGRSNGQETGYSAGMRGKKGSVYDGGHRVACFAWWPGTLKAGQSVTRLTSHRDWLPTLIDLCALEAPEGVPFDGRSIRPLLEGRDEDWPDRTFYLDRQPDQRVLGTLDAAKSRSAPQWAVITETHRLVGGELYDIREDPGQTRDLAETQPDLVARLYAGYREWHEEVGAEGERYARFQLGAAEENPTQFTVRDWHPTDGRVIWKKEQLGDPSLTINGFWEVAIVEGGRYLIELSRFPEDDPEPMGADHARLIIGDREWTADLDPASASAIFRVDLEAGPARLQTWLKDATSGVERGAYHLRVERLDPGS